MKTIIKTITFAVASVAVMGLAASCTDGFEDANRPGGALNNEEINRDNYSTGSFMVQMETEAFPEQENTYQMNQDLIGNYLGRFMTYANNGFAGSNFAKMNAPVGWVRYPFADSMKKTVSAFNEIARLSTKESLPYAWALILRAQSFLRLTDMYGPLPVLHFGEARSPYDAQDVLYDHFFQTLNNSISVLEDFLATTPDSKALVKVDAVYGGDFAKWLKFARSLKLRLAMRIRYVEPDLALQYAQEAIEGGVITSTDENALLQTYRQITVTNPLEMIWNSYNDARMGASMDSYLNGYEDPRREKMFQPATITGGGFHGVANGLGSTEQKFYTKMSAPNIFGETPMRWLLASEVAFLKAEFKLLKGDKSGAKSDYEEGIRLSFLENGLSASDAADYAQSMKTPARFIDMSENPTKYSKNALGTVSVKWAEDGNELERIITQKWIALYPNGMEAWAEFRRTGFPKLFPINENSNDPSIDKNKQIRRVIFPKSEYANNAGAVNAATRLLGGPDSGGTRLWWDAR